MSIDELANLALGATDTSQVGSTVQNGNDDAHGPMYLSQLRIRNFRQFGGSGVNIPFEPGVTVLLGPNDSGKTAILDAIRYILTTRDQEYIRSDLNDFHIASNGKQAEEYEISARFSNLGASDISRFVEYLTYEDKTYFLDLTLTAKIRQRAGRTGVYTTVTSGKDGLGALVDSLTRELLACTYLRPLRDAERELAPGRGSRLSRVLQSYQAIDLGGEFDSENVPQSKADLEGLSLSAQAQLFEYLVNKNQGVDSAAKTLNTQYLENLTLKNDSLGGAIGLVSPQNNVQKLRQILERLQLNLFNMGETERARGRYGLGSNNLLYIACELLLIAQDSEGLGLLLVEEPEAHIHPQRQLQTLVFLREKAEKDGLQVIVTTHSPVLASKAKTENAVLVTRKGPFSLAKNCTKLSSSDYRYLDRFLDVTRSNLFFSENVLIVEGDAEEILLPTIAKLIGCDFTKFGVSVVNVRGVGLRRYARIFLRRDLKEDEIPIRVACITDRDIVPDTAISLMSNKFQQSKNELDYQKDPDKNDLPNGAKRKWRSENDPLFALLPEGGKYGDTSLITLGKDIYLEEKKAADSGLVKTFISDHWTLEYDLAEAGLAREVFISAELALKDDAIHDPNKPEMGLESVRCTAEYSFDDLVKQNDSDQIASHVYRKFVSQGASKAVAAQYLCDLLEEKFVNDPDGLSKVLPRYLNEAIEWAVSGDSQDG
ncbi:AAA family ATPase [Corynebacterium sp. H128]|uniref:ATP-dependent nuclease n=1 Tax=Corynebacterium sp. H128 TaxID=3133427 RepID=UPI0030A8744D